MRPILRFRRWLLDRLPIYNANDCARSWFAGIAYGEKQIGLTRDARGRFKGISQ